MHLPSKALHIFNLTTLSWTNRQNTNLEDGGQPVNTNSPLGSIDCIAADISVNCGSVNPSKINLHIVSDVAIFMW